MRSLNQCAQCGFSESVVPNPSTTGGVMSQSYVKAEYPLSDVTARIIAAAAEVHRELGPGFEEVIYQRALARELPAHGL